MTLHTEHPIPGVARVDLGGGRRLTYRCDSLRHRVVVSDEFERVRCAFGAFGRGPGAFDTPLDLVFVRPQFASECLPVTGPDAVWVAVADYGNCRVQILELDGAPVGAIGMRAYDGDPPSALEWHAPYLHVRGLDGRRTEVHVTSALFATAAAGPVLRSVREWLPSRPWVN